MKKTTTKRMHAHAKTRKPTPQGIADSLKQFFPPTSHMGVPTGTPWGRLRARPAQTKTATEDQGLSIADQIY